MAESKKFDVVEDLFAKNENLEKVFKTEDGQVFVNENNAKNWAKKLGKLKIVKILKK